MYAVFLLVSAWRRVGVFCCEATLFLALWLGTLAASWLFQLWGHCLPLGFSGLGAPTAPCPGWAGTVGTRGGSLPHPSSSLGPQTACLLLPTPFPGSCLERFLRVAERARGEQSSCVSAELESASSWSFRAGFGLFLGDHSCSCYGAVDDLNLLVALTSVNTARKTPSSCYFYNL